MMQWKATNYTRQWTTLRHSLFMFGLVVGGRSFQDFQICLLMKVHISCIASVASLKKGANNG